MRDMALPVSFRWDPGFVAEIDRVRGDVPRSVFVRRAVEQALGEFGEAGDTGVPIRPTRALPEPVTSAPAEQPYRQSVPGPNVEPVRSSSAAKRDVHPVPKGKS